MQQPCTKHYSLSHVKKNSLLSDIWTSARADSGIAPKKQNTTWGLLSDMNFTLSAKVRF